MILKNSLSLIQDSNLEDLDNSSRKTMILDDLMKEQINENIKAKTVHRRRDLDSLG